MCSNRNYFWTMFLPIFSIFCTDFIGMSEITNVDYAPPSRPEGPRRCPGRGNAGGPFFLPHFWILPIYAKYCHKVTIIRFSVYLLVSLL